MINDKGMISAVGRLMFPSLFRGSDTLLDAEDTKMSRIRPNLNSRKCSDALQRVGRAQQRCLIWKGRHVWGVTLTPGLGAEITDKQRMSEQRSAWFLWGV